MTESIDSVLGDTWGSLTECILEMMAPPSTWVLSSNSEGEAQLEIGNKLAPLYFRSIAQASAVQGVLTYAKLAYDRNTVKPN